MKIWGMSENILNKRYKYSEAQSGTGYAVEVSVENLKCSLISWPPVISSYV